VPWAATSRTSGTARTTPTSQLELVRTAGAVALMPGLTLPPDDPALAVRDVADAVVSRRLMVLTRDTPTAPALAAFLATVRDQADRLR